MTVTRTDWAMAQQITVTGNGDHTVVISGGACSTTESTSGAYEVEHFAIRGASSQQANVAVVDGDRVTSDFATIGARPAHGSALIGVHTSPHLHTSSTTLNLLPPVEVVRFGIARSTMETSQGVFDSGQQTIYDAVFSDLETRGIQAILTLGTTPAWARSGGNELSPSTDPTTHGDWVAAVIDRWGDQILCVDPWNEPENATFSGTDVQYVAMLEATHDAVDGAKPVCLGPFALNNHAHIEDLFTAGLDGTMFDWVDVHPYPFSFGAEPSPQWLDPHGMPPAVQLDGSVVGGLHKIESVLASHGVTGRNIVVSEVGVSTNEVDTTDPQARMTAAAAADLLGDTIDLLRRIGHIQAICVHEAKDHVAGGTGVLQGYGLVDSGDVRRSTWALIDSLV